MSAKLSKWVKHPAFWWTAACVVLFIAVPWLTVKLVHSDAGMAVCFLLFYAIDPVVAIAAGMFAGKDPRRLWFLPLLIPLLFLAGTNLCFARDPAFTTYALLYLMLGGTTMLIFCIMTNGRKRE